jgi:hypothetical protein
MVQALSSAVPEKVSMEPLRILAEMLQKTALADTIGGAPQLVRIAPHMNTRPFCVLWGKENKPTLFGRQLFDYENCDYWIIDPFTGQASEPRNYGRRPGRKG